MGRGGYRKGAGRKPSYDAARRVTLTTKILPETRERMKAAKARTGLTLAELIDHAFATLDF